MGNKNVGLSAEHGCFMKDIGSKEWVNLAASFDMSWQEKSMIFSSTTLKTPGSNIERKSSINLALPSLILTWEISRQKNA